MPQDVLSRYSAHQTFQRKQGDGKAAQRHREKHITRNPWSEFEGFEG